MSLQDDDGDAHANTSFLDDFPLLDEDFDLTTCNSTGWFMEDLSLFLPDTDDTPPGHARYLQDEKEEQELPIQDETSSNVDTMEVISFPVKLYMMLENAQPRGYQDIVSWVQDGTAFKVHDHDRFVAHVMPLYFNQSKYESFRRQLNLYRFHRVAKGKDRGIVSHPLLRAGAKSKCRNIQR